MVESRVRWAAIGAAVAVSFGAGGIALVTAAGSSTSGGLVLATISPCRLVDTRDGTGVAESRLGADDTFTVSARGDVGNCIGLPADTAALAINLSGVGATAPSFLTTFPGGEARPLVSSLSLSPEVAVSANGLTVSLSDAGALAVFNRFGTVDVVIDVLGVYVPGESPSIPTVPGDELFWVDVDGDLFGSNSDVVLATTAPVGYVANNDDCDDTDDLINPDATEVAGNGVDEDCDGVASFTFYVDADSDTYTTADTFVGNALTGTPSGHQLALSAQLDCDDSAAGVNPGASEVPGNGVDDDCDGVGIVSDGNASLAALSADGSRVVFRSAATNIVANDTNGNTDVFLFDVATGETTLVSAGLLGEGADDHSDRPAISADGAYVVFVSGATDLIVGDSNARDDVFLYEVATGITTKVGPAAASDGHASDPAISGDGQFVVFESRATNLVAGDTNGDQDIFLYDVANDTTTRVSVDSSGGQSDASSHEPEISADGLWVVYHSSSAVLVAGDTNSLTDVFLYGVTAGTTTRVSVDSLGAEADGTSDRASVSGDGGRVEYQSDATNLVAGDTNARQDIFVYDMVAGTTTRVSVDSVGAEANDASKEAVISDDGEFVVFESGATNLVAGDTNGLADVFMYELATGTLTRESLDGLGGELAGSSDDPTTSGDAGFVAFDNFAALIPSDASPSRDIYRINTSTGEVVLVSGGR